MLIQSFENQSNLAEFFEHTDYYLVVVTRHQDNKRTEYKLQKTDYVYDMLKVKGSVTALVNCAKDLIVNFSYISPTVTTDNKNGYQGSDLEATSERLGVVDSAGEALFSLTNADFRTIQKALLSYYHWTDNHDFCFGDDEEKKQQSLENIARLRNLFINAEGLGA